MKPMRTLVTLALCTLLAAGCSAVSVIYNNAPSYLAGELEDAFDLDDAQSAELDRRMQEFFVWHRREELALYQQFLEEAALNAADGISAEEFLEFVDGLRTAFRRLMTRAIVDFSDMGLTLTPGQIDHYEQYFREISADYRDYLEKSPQQREIYRVDRAIERMERWFGSFDRNQLDMLESRLRELPEFYEAWIRFREERQQAFIATLRAAPTAGIDNRHLENILLDPDTEYARAFYRERDAYWQAYAIIIEDLSDMLSKKQRKHLVKRLQKYSSAFEELVEDDQF